MLEQILVSSVCANVNDALLAADAALLAESIRHVSDQETEQAESRKAVLPMPMLKPALMWPGRHARVAQALAALQQIDTIELSHIKRVHGKRVFVLDVFLKRQASRIPTNRCSRAGSMTLIDEEERALHHIKPDYQLEKTERDLNLLQHFVWVHAQQAAVGSCAYCGAFFALAETTYSKSRLRFAMLWPNARARKTMVEGMVNDMISLCIEASTEKSRSRCCEGFENIPPRLHQFTRRQCTIDRLYSFV